MTKSNELQIGKAGEYIVCADLIIMGLIAYPSEQGLPYDVVIDNGFRLLKCQVKTTEKPRVIPQRGNVNYAYIFNIKRHGKNAVKRYTDGDVDLFALVELETRSVAYLLNEDMPDTINLRVEHLRGKYYDEKGIIDYKKVIGLKNNGLTNRGIADRIGINESTVGRMLKDNYTPHKTSARYFNDLKKDKEWFQNLK